MEGDRAITISSDCIGNAIQRARPLPGRTTGPARRSTKGQWTPEEDEVLRQAVQQFNGKNWKKIAECFKDRTDVQCLHRWQKVLNPELIKGPWSKDEDEVIIQLVEKLGAKKWSTIAQHLPGRIGKQCRERWHNHLNPSINKEAWTQEEELALIRAHQIYGNKWAELTKFLPGRTDNAIKNHWNSSVKKKLDQYLASGLLQQFQGLPLLPYPNQSSALSSSKVKQCSDDSTPKDGAELEEVSESSQGSTFVGCSQSTSDIGNAVVQTRDDCRTAEELSSKKDPNCSPASISKNYLTSFQEVAFAKSEMPHELGGSSMIMKNNFPHQWQTSMRNVVQTRDDCRTAEELSSKKDPNFSPTSCSKNCLTAFQEVAFAKSEMPHELGGSSMIMKNNFPHQWETSMGNNWQMNTSEQTKMTLQDLTQESLEQFMQYLNGSENHQILPFPLRNSLGLSNGIAIDESFPSGIDANRVDGNEDPLLSNYQIPGDCTFPAQAYYSVNTNMLATTSFTQQHSVTPQLPSHDGSLVFDVSPSQLNDTFIANQEQVSLPEREDGFICLNESHSSPCNDGMEEKTPHAHDTSILVAVSDFGSAPSCDVQTSAPEDPVHQDEQKDSRALCYEPPRFPSLDIPFVSCDLIPTGTDMLQEYSPLGTRRFWTSINRLWDSPSREKSPDAVLKSAAKSYLCTPSILKKRNRDLVSPLSEKRIEKKLESDMNPESFYNLSREFSRLDVMFDEVGNDKAVGAFPSSNEHRIMGDSTEDKENVNPDLGKAETKDVEGTKCNLFSDCKILINDAEIAVPRCEMKHTINYVDRGTENEVNRRKTEVEGNDASEYVNQASGALIGHNMDSLSFFSPDRFGIKGDRPLALNVRALGNQYSRRLEASANVVSTSTEISGPSACSLLAPDKKDENISAIPRSVCQASSSTPVVNKVGISRDGVGVENLNIFVDTPFKRSIESPSAWKSPWFMNSYLLGSRVDTDGTMEEFGHFFSPGDQSYDALGLMKQLGEQTASAFANAQEVLGDETPESLLKKKCSKIQEADGEYDEPEQHSDFASGAMAERRTLDFSDCVSPGKGTESGKLTNAVSFSSPSSYLLKGCR